MLTPRELLDIVDGSTAITDQLYTYLIREIVTRMMLRLGRGEKYLLTSSDRWRIKIMQDAGYLYQDIIQEIGKYTKLQQAEIQAAFQDAGIRALAWDDKIYEAAGLSPLPLWQSPHLVRLMERNYNATMQAWQNFTRTTADEAQRLFINECDFAYHKVSTGAVSYSQAVREAIETAVSGGIYVNWTDAQGNVYHRDTIEVAIARAVRTGVAQAAGDISLKRMEEMDWDIILVSSHMGARIGDGGENPGNHAWWQGKYYSRTGQDKRFLPFSATGYGTGEGLSGYNCRHSFGSGTGRDEDNPFSKVDTEENKRVYLLEQRQRLLERRIRHTKRDLMGWQATVDSCEDEGLKADFQKTVDRKSALLKRQNEEYREFCKQNNLRTQNERLQIAQWSRAEANKAIAAARRYEKEREK